jgi:hypothetical protein
VAEIVTGVLAVTAVVVMVNEGETLAPAGTVTEAGTATAALLLDKLTTAPPEGAGPLKRTVFPVVDAPPVTEPDDRFTAAIDTFDEVTVKAAVAVAPP